jgi:mannose-1-phosphate guanylyltransferase
MSKKQQKSVTTVLLCGGSGKRIWPLSRTHYPKQFLPLFKKQTLFQKTVERSLPFSETIIIVTNIEHQFLAEQQIKDMNIEHPPKIEWLLEPVPKDTAPAIAFAALHAKKDSPLLICPCDHLISGEFNTCIETAAKASLQGDIITIGLKPNRPETGYGYIHTYSPPKLGTATDVKEFKEKPNKDTAEKWIKKDTYFWNSGIFCFMPDTYLTALSKHAPDIHLHSQLAYKNKKTYSSLHILDKTETERIPKNSIDYAVLEHIDNQKMVAAKNITWNDAGSFDNLIDEGASLSLDNLNHQHVHIDSINTHILNASRSITTIGLKDIIIVDTADALLLCKKGESQKLKQATEKIAQESPHLINSHVRTYRPWGYYDVLREEPGFKVKKLHVYPGKRLSLQKHKHRGEHWVIVKGLATIIRDHETFELPANQSITVPKGAVHRLENNTSEPLSIIETQTGAYLEEDDIERLQDDFKRL